MNEEFLGWEERIEAKGKTPLQGGIVSHKKKKTWRWVRRERGKWNLEMLGNELGDKMSLGSVENEKPFCLT